MVLFPTTFLLLLLTVVQMHYVVYAQQVGTNQAENHPPLTTYNCDSSGDCTPNTNTQITLDQNWRWIHQVGSSTNCYTGDEWDTSICPDPQTCAQNCALDGAAYEQTYGITTAGDSMSIRLVTVGQYDTNIGARTYLMADDEHYSLLMLKNREIAFDIDVSSLNCGINGALYLVDMAADGGSGKYPGNKAGAKYGTGYCDAQCPRDEKFLAGLANINDWDPSPDGDPNSGWGEFGSCCTEIDLVETNMISTSITPHMCSTDGQYICNSTAPNTDCGDNGGDRYLGVCDKNGCDANPYRLGNTNFFGSGAGPSGGCSLQTGVNNMGTILGQPTIETDPIACCSLCNTTVGCAGFTFVSTTSNCFLKSALGNPIADPDATSGTVTPPPVGGGIDTTSPFTVVTQFITNNSSDNGILVEISRYFIQNGKKIPMPVATNLGPGNSNYSTITDEFCKVKAAAFNDNDNFETFGGLQRLGEVMDDGLVLVLSLWVDYEVHMLWLDSDYPTNASTSSPGVARGTCATSSGNPDDVIKNYPDATVTFSKISIGPIGFMDAALTNGKQWGTTTNPIPPMDSTILPTRTE